MATLSTKVSMDLAELFEQYCKDNRTTPSALLRELIEVTVRWRRFAMYDPEVESPTCWLFVDPDWEFSDPPGLTSTPSASGRRKLGLPGVP
jgi:hypothetical protein